MKEIINKLEKETTEKFSKVVKITNSLSRYQDDELKDKYDNNYFFFEGRLSKEDYLKAIEYQNNKADEFVKFMTSSKLEENYGLEECVVYAMMLKGTTSKWKTNDKLTFHKPSLEEAIAIELKHYGESYGKDFAMRNITRMYPKLDYMGAYLDGKMVGSLSYSSNEEATCIDDLIVDIDYRKQYIGTSLLKYVIDNHGKDHVFLHAYEDDTPKEMYFKLGFDIVDTKYEYFSNLKELFNKEEKRN